MNKNWAKKTKEILATLCLLGSTTGITATIPLIRSFASQCSGSAQTQRRAPLLLESSTTKALDKMLGRSQYRITEVLPLFGSGRQYIRVEHQGLSKILMIFDDSRPDNLTFLKTSDFLAGLKIPVPRVYNREHSALKNGQGFILLEDLGSMTLLDRQYSYRQRTDYVNAISQITNLHNVDASTHIQKNADVLQPRFDKELYLWEQNDFFREKFLEGYLGKSKDDVDHFFSREEGEAMAEMLASYPQQLIHRDFQSENIMFRRNGELVLIDYQGLRLGRAEYDLASLIYDPYATIRPELREELIRESFVQLKKKGVLPVGLNEETWRKDYFYPAATQRLMQALGAYGRLVNEAGRDRYKQYMEPAVKNLIEVLENSGRFPELKNELETLEFSPR